MKGCVEIESPKQKRDEEHNVYILSIHRTSDVWTQKQFKVYDPEAPVDFETAIEKTGLGRFNILVLMMMLPATWSSGFDTSALSMVLPIAGCHLQLSNIQKGFLHSAIYLGMVTSGFVWGYLSDTYGRQKLLAAGYLLDSLCSIASSMATSFWPMFFFKFFSGFMINGPYSIIMAYISEVFSAKYRDSVLILAGAYFALGSVIQPALGLVFMPLDFHFDVFGLVEVNSWRVYLMICALPSLTAGVAALYCVESPKFLMEKGRHDEALAAFHKIFYMNTGRDPSQYQVKKLMVTERKVDQFEDGVKSEVKAILKKMLDQMVALFKPPYLSRTLITSFVMIGSVTVLNGIRLMLPEIFSHLADSRLNSSIQLRPCEILHSPREMETDCNMVTVDSDVYTNMMWVYAFCFLCQCVFNCFLKYLNKKAVIIFTSLVPGLCAFFIPMLTVSYTLALASVYISFLNVHFYAMMSVIVVLFPTGLRATSVSLTMMVSRAGLLFGNVFVASQIYTSCFTVFYVCGGVLIVVGLCNFFIPKPDKEKTIIEEKI